MIKKIDGPIFYHPDDCDCVECEARRQKGGLDYDPTNDDEEFEAHEEEVMKEIEKGSIYKMKFRKNQTIKFTYPSDLTGLPLIFKGTILGFGSAVRKMWPIEMGEAPDDYLLVWRRDVYGNDQHFAVDPMDVIEEPVVDIKKDGI